MSAPSVLSQCRGAGEAGMQGWRQGSLVVGNIYLCIEQFCFVCYSRVAIMNTSPIWPLRARCFGGPVFQVAALKVGALYMWPILSTPQGKAENWSSLLPQYGAVSRMGFMATVCLTILMWVFSQYPMCRNHSYSFWISLSRNQAMHSCICGASVGGGKFRSLICHHLGDIPDVRNSTYESWDEINI